MLKKRLVTYAASETGTMSRENWSGLGVRGSKVGTPSPPSIRGTGVYNELCAPRMHARHAENVYHTQEKIWSEPTVKTASYPSPSFFLFIFRPVHFTFIAYLMPRVRRSIYITFIFSFLLCFVLLFFSCLFLFPVFICFVLMSRVFFFSCFVFLACFSFSSFFFYFLFPVFFFFFPLLLSFFSFRRYGFLPADFCFYVLYVCPCASFSLPVPWVLRKHWPF